MADIISYHYSLIIRCWRDANGALRGWVVDATTQCSHPFATRAEMVNLIESLTRDLSPDADIAKNSKGG
jgi:hypothetical protein